MRNAFLIFTALMMLAAPARAANQCYSQDELKAEQLLRLHSELMVITVTCKQSSSGESLVPYYTGFTQAHLTSLHNAEQTMMKHYKACYGGDGIERLDKLRTKLGNQYGKEIADTSAPIYCAHKRDRVVQMYAATPAMIDMEVRFLMANQHGYEGLCTAPPSAHVAKQVQ